MRKPKVQALCGKPSAEVTTSERAPHESASPHSYLSHNFLEPGKKDHSGLSFSSLLCLFPASPSLLLPECVQLALPIS